MPDFALLRAALSAVTPRRPSPAEPVTIERPGQETRPGDVAAYADVCGADTHDPLPILYPHVLAFGLSMRLMARSDFPFPLPGLVQVRNVVARSRPVGLVEPLDIAVHAEGPRPHPKGRVVDVVTDIRTRGEHVWAERSTYLRRESGTASDSRPVGPNPGGDTDGWPVVDEWTAPSNIGRRYASVSGDRNPIHLWPLTARLFGFRTPIAHGMWTAGRALAALEHRIPGACAVTVDFHAPVRLPSQLVMPGEPDGSRFAVHSAGDRLHLTGSIDDQ